MGTQDEPPNITHNEFFQIINNQKLREKKEIRDHCVSVWEQGSHLELDGLRRLGWSGPSAREILAAHPFATRDSAVREIGSAFEILKSARDQLVEDYGAHHGALSYGDFKNMNVFQSKLTQDVFQFVFSAEALVQSYRRLISIGPEYKAGFNAVREKIFDNKGLSEFIKKLRNCYGHQSIIIVEPRGSVRIAEIKTVTSSVNFNKTNLLALRDAWNSDSRRFIEESEGLNVVDILNDYFQRAQKLFSAYTAQTGIVSESGFREMARCNEAIKVAGHLAYLSVVLQNAKKNGINPYSHLAAEFSENELRRIHTFPAHSKAQVDYIISLKDVVGLTDNSTRQKLYELFQCK